MSSKDESLSPAPAPLYTVKVAGSEPVLTKCDIKKVPKYSKLRDLDYQTLSNIDKPIYTFNISGVDVYIEEGCTFIVNELPYRNNDGAILITNHGKLTIGRLKYCPGVSIVTASQVFVENDLNLGETLFKETHFSSSFARLFRTVFTNGSVFTGDLFESFDASFNNTTLSGFEKIRVKDCGYTGGDEFTLISDGNNTNTLLIDGITLPTHSQDLTDIEEKIAINIQHRVDIGSFAGVRPIPFVRSGAADLIAGGTVFLEADFWPAEEMPDVGSIYVQQLEKNHPQVIKTRAMMTDLKFWGGFEPSFKPALRSTDTEHMLVKSILVGIASRINVFKTLEALR